MLAAETCEASAAFDIVPRSPAGAALVAEYRRSQGSLATFAADTLLETLGLGDVKIEWAVFSFSSPIPRVWEGPDAIRRCSAALRFDHDAGTPGLAKGAERDGEVEGLACWKVARPACVAASLDGKLLLAAPERRALARLVRLYKYGEGSACRGDWPEKEGLIRITVPDVVGEMRKAIPAMDAFLEDLESYAPEGAAAMRTLKDFTCTISFAGKNGFAFDFAVRAATKTDAGSLGDMLQSGIDTAVLPGDATVSTNGAKVGFRLLAGKNDAPGPLAAILAACITASGAKETN